MQKQSYCLRFKFLYDLFHLLRSSNKISSGSDNPKYLAKRTETLIPGRKGEVLTIYFIICVFHAYTFAYYFISRQYTCKN